jgi:hypothetical protein
VASAVRHGPFSGSSLEESKMTHHSEQAANQIEFEHLVAEADLALATRDAEIKQLRYQRDGLRTAARELLARLDRSPERILLTAAIAASEDK